MSEERPTGNKNASLLKSFRNALQGIIVLFRRERNFRIHVGIAAIACSLAAGLQFTLLQWLMLLLTIGFVMVAEAFNSAIEALVDLVEPKLHPLAGKAKDIAAGAVLIAAVISVIIGLSLFVPPLWNLVNHYLE